MGLVGVSTQIRPVLGEVRQVHEAELQAHGAPAHLVEQPEAAAVEIRRGDDVRPGVQQLQHRGDRRQATGEGVALRPALQVGHAALEGEARRVLAA